MLKRIWKKGNPPTLLARIQIDIATMENFMKIPKKKTRNKTTPGLSNPTTGHVPWENHNSERHMYPTFIAGLFTIARTQKQPKCPLTDEWIKKLLYICTVEYYSTIKEWMRISWTEVDELKACYTEWSKSDREKQIAHINTYTWNLEKQYW